MAAPIEERLRLLLEAADGKPIPTADLLEAIWGPGHDRKPCRALRVHMHRLRRKLAKESLQLIGARGVGYRLVPAA